MQGTALLAGVETAVTAVGDDCNRDTIAQYTVGASASAFDTANGWLELKDGTAIYPTARSMSTGFYVFNLKRSTGATDVFNVTIANNAITVTGAGVCTIGGTAYTGTALTSPTIWMFVADGTSISIWCNGVLLGTKTGLTLAYSNISMSRTTANIYVLGWYAGALLSGATNGVAPGVPGIPGGARYDTQEEVYLALTNPAKYATAKMVVTAKTTDAAADDVQTYFYNTTDSSYIDSADSKNTTDLTVTTSFTDFIEDLLVRYRDRADTLKLSVRRKNYSGVAYDNQSTVFVETLALAPTTEV